MDACEGLTHATTENGPEKFMFVGLPIFSHVLLPLNVMPLSYKATGPLTSGL